MPILQAGPFAALNDSFSNAPGTTSNHPVNCAKDTTAEFWPWRYNVILSDIFQQTKTATDNILIDEQFFDASTSIFARFDYRYQASQAFTATLDYEIITGFENGVANISVTILGVGVVFSDENPLGGFGVSGSETINFPISVVPRLVEVRASARFPDAFVKVKLS